MTPLLANAVTDLFNWLGDFSANWWFLGIIFVIAYLDSIIPIVPSETMVIIGGVAAGAGSQSLVAVIASGAVGAFLGDNTAYYIGDRLSDWIQRKAAEKPKWQHRLDWAHDQIQRRGGLLLITARFVPGGRTALTISSGVTRQSRRWFVGWITIAVVIWATYAALLGFIGGRSFQDNHTMAFAVAFAGAISVTIVIEVVRHVWSKRSSATA
jgi:membrane protein DedA with SNARE-associated domain